MKDKQFSEEIFLCGTSLDDAIDQFTSIKDANPDKKLYCYTELDYRDCYYESDTPYPKVFIREH